MNTPKHVNPPHSGDGRREWVEQWMATAPELEGAKIAELRAMTEREAARIVNEVLPNLTMGSTEGTFGSPPAWWRCSGYSCSVGKR